MGRVYDGWRHTWTRLRDLLIELFVFLAPLLRIPGPLRPKQFRRIQSDRTQLDGEAAVEWAQSDSHLRCARAACALPVILLLAALFSLIF